MGVIKSWSHSRLGEFDKCKFKVWLKVVQHIDEPDRPLPPGKTEHANDRGSRIHDNCEQFVDGRTDDLTPEAEKHFGMQLAMLRTLHEEGAVSLEGEWGMDDKWNPTDWKTAWHRCKLDAIVFWDPTPATRLKARIMGAGATCATVIDYKSGKRWGNEIKHGEQMQLYLLNAFLRYPDLEYVETELWYVDLGEVAKQSMTRSQALRFKSNFDRRGRAITNATEFPPNPNKFSCRWCMYGTHNGGTGHCSVGVAP